MTELLVQKELRQHGLDYVLEQYGLESDQSDGLVLLNYGFKAAKSDPIVQECRSLILEDGTWNVVSMAFKRFFNPGEGTAAVIDWETASAHQKMDGSLLQLFYHKDRWRCSTRGRLDGSGGLSDSSEFKTFGDLFWHLMEPHRHHLEDEDQRLMPRDHCYPFELVSKWNRIVTVYEKPALYLLTMRHVPSLEEVSDLQVDQVAEQVGFGRPKRWKFRSLEEASEATELLGVTEEGFVVCDRESNRIKVKSVSYLTLFNLFNGGQPDFWGIVITGEDSEFLAYFPQYTEEVEAKKKLLKETLSELEKVWESNRDAEDQKTFAMAVKDLPGSGLLFSTRKLSLNSISDFWDTLDHAAKQRAMEKIGERSGMR